VCQHTRKIAAQHYDDCIDDDDDDNNNNNNNSEVNLTIVKFDEIL
jgi:hypothetical protein